MKPFVIFIPGCFGSTLLKSNEIVWPINQADRLKIAFNNIIEKPFNKIFSSKPEPNLSNTIKECLTKVSDRNLVVGPITSNYDNIIELIKEQTEDNFFIFSYDWRRSFNDIVDEFAKKVDELDVGNRDIIIVSHSAGGVVGYKYLCNEIKYDTIDSNFSKIKKIIAIGSPIQGCLKALTAIMGLVSQSILSPDEMKNIIDTGFFESIYELCPSNLHNCFFHKKTKTPLPNSHIIQCLKENNFPLEKLNTVFDFKTEQMEQKPNPRVNHLFISGTYTSSPMCSGFLVDVENNNSIECIFDYGAGDGTVLKEESIPNLDFCFRKKNVIGKHCYLTEIDEVLNIVKDEINDSVTNPYIITSILEESKNGLLEFKLYFHQNNNKYQIKDIKAKHISFHLKTIAKDITKRFDKKKENDIFFFKSKLPYGFLKFRNIFFDYNDGEKIVKNYSKEIFVELEKPGFKNFF